MATTQQPPMQYAPPNQSFEVVPLRELRNWPAPVDCPLCGQRTRTQPVTKLAPVNCGDLTKALCLGFCGVTTIRPKWVEHTCINCGGLLVRHHPSLQPSTRGVVNRGGGDQGETEVIPFAQRPMVNA